MPLTVEAWTGRVDATVSSWEVAQVRLERNPQEIQPAKKGEKASVYRERFRNGASVFPRIFFLVEKLPPGPLGLVAGKAAVRSARSAYEKKPWRDLDSVEGVLESEFVYPLYLAEHVLPYRTLHPASAVIPWYRGALLDSSHPHLELFPDLAKWWIREEALWNAHRSSERLTLAQRLDYHRELSAQFPIQDLRVVYSKSGMHLAAATLSGRRHVIDHTLYWATAASPEEALYLCAILNSAEITRQVRPLMSYGKDERHIDKHVWRLPIPGFDPRDPLHMEIAEVAGELAKAVAALPLDESRSFIALRRQVREFLAGDFDGRRIEALIGKLLG